jgi:hypothetical protein
MTLITDVPDGGDSTTHPQHHRDLATAVMAAPQTAQLTFTQTAGDGTYTGSVALPAGAVLLDIIVANGADWDGAAFLEIGDGGDAQGFLLGAEIQSGGATWNDGVARPFVGLASSLFLRESVVGTQLGNYYDNTTQSTVRSYPSGGTITATVTQTGGTTVGRTGVTVVYAVPPATAATKA